MKSTTIGAAVLAAAVLGGVAWMGMQGDESMQGQSARAAHADSAVVLTVYKTPTCGCCENWVQHMEQNGFAVERVDLSAQELAATKDRLGVPAGMRTCHTAVAEGKIIEGHVPAEEVWRFLEEDRPEAGLAVPGMPMGSPGMEGPRSDPYVIYAFDGDGSAIIYATRE